MTTPRAHELAVKLSVHHLRFQLETGGFFDPAESFSDKLKDGFALGYVYGNCDFSCQVMGLHDDSQVIEMTTDVCIELFGVDAGPKICTLMLDMAQEGQDLPNFFEATMLGGNEMREMYNASVGGEEAPIKMGLARRLRGMPSLTEELG